MYTKALIYLGERVAGSDEKEKWRRKKSGIVNLFSFLDELSPPGRLYRAMSAHSLIKCPKKEHLFPTFREK
jgi:hypothetical protein